VCDVAGCEAPGVKYPVLTTYYPTDADGAQRKAVESSPELSICEGCVSAATRKLLDGARLLGCVTPEGGRLDLSWTARNDDGSLIPSR